MRTYFAGCFSALGFWLLPALALGTRHSLVTLVRVFAVLSSQASDVSMTNERSLV